MRLIRLIGNAKRVNDPVARARKRAYCADSSPRGVSQMPMVLVAGVVATQPKSEPFPDKGRPHCRVGIRAEGEGRSVIYEVIGFEAEMEELELLQLGDSVAIQGALQVESQGSKVSGIYVIARMVMPLARRSPNRFSNTSVGRASI
jgi:hypothetical protein